LVETIKAFMRGEMPAERKSSSTVKISPFNKTSVTKKSQAEESTKSRSLVPILIGIPILGVLIIGGGIFLFGSDLFQSTNDAVTPSAIAQVPVVIEITATPAENTTIEPTQPTSNLTVIGGADKIAFLKSNEIWVMNIDGSDLQQLTTDGVGKFNLQWLPDGNTILYMSGKSVKTVELDTLREEIIMTYPAAEFFDSFQVSPDGTQAAISVNRELFVVPYNVEKLKAITNRNHLVDFLGKCIFYDKFAVTGALWSDDGTRLAVKVLANKGGARVDAIRIVDITQCYKADFEPLDQFPLDRFNFNDFIEHFSWDGDLLFFMNSPKRNGGFGDLVFYNGFTHKFEFVAPYEGNCCYRDASFSPDGTHVIFAFQDIRLGDTSPTKLFYLPVDTLSSPRVLEAIPLPENFFTLRNDEPIPVLRPAK
jgi:dipeptidyl aminopeptidase/acylaminoacyl peptidase